MEKKVRDIISLLNGKCRTMLKRYTIVTVTSPTPQSQSKKGALMESWQIVEHEFETTGSNRAQTRPYGEDTRDLSVRLFKVTHISQRKHKHFETSSHFLYKIIPIKEVTNCDRSEEFSKEIR